MAPEPVYSPPGEKTSLAHWSPTSALGGIEMAALTLIQQTRGVRHLVATGDDSGPAAALWREAGADVVRVDGWGGILGMAWARRWKAFVRERQVRRLIAWSPTRLPQVLAPLTADSRCVVHLGNVGGFSRRARWQGRATGALYRRACRPILLACSQAVAASLETEPAFAGMPLVVVPNAVRPAFFGVGEARPKSASPPKVWGMVARLDGLKDHRSLIEAVRLLPQETEFRLELVGDGALSETLRQHAASAGLERRIRFLGALSRPEEAMRGWEAFVFATTRAEGFGIAAAEAMAAGLPCVFSDVAALREVAGDCAYFAPEGSPAALCAKMLEVIRNPSSAFELAEEGRRRALTLYSAEVFARRYLQELGMMP